MSPCERRRGQEITLIPERIEHRDVQAAERPLPLVRSELNVGGRFRLSTTMPAFTKIVDRYWITTDLHTRLAARRKASWRA